MPVNSDGNDKPEEKEVSRWRRGSAALARRIFKAELPEQYIRTLPAQSLYCVLRHNGLQSSADLLELATLQQVRIMMDLDFWAKDRFQEDRFWEWLAITDATDGLELLQKLFKCFDLKLVSLMFSRYVEVFFQDEPTDEPPSEHWYTPDKGSTWVHVETDNEDRNFLLNRLLALVFETDADLYYQLLNIPTVTTPSQLEEESYQDKIKRLAGEGVPEMEIANELREPLPLQDALSLFKSVSEPTIVDVRVIEPLIYDSPSADAMQRLLNSVKSREQVEGELTFILNCAIVAWDIAHHDPEAVTSISERVKGCIAIGLDLLEDAGLRDVARSYETMGLKNLFRLGYTLLMQLQRKAVTIPPEALQRFAESDREFFALIAGLREAFPCLCRPASLEDSDNESSSLTVAFSSLKEVRSTLERIEEYTPKPLPSA